MKKLAIYILLLSILLSGCCTTHDWQDATCEMSRYCEKCGKTDGNPLGHNWQDATCEDPQRCLTCGQEGSSAYGHTWKDATCEDPQQCLTCGQDGGPAYGHKWNNATCEKPKTCSICGTEDGTKAAHTWKEATCEVAQTCTLCGITGEAPKGHNWKEETDSTPKTCINCGIMIPMNLPESGQLFINPNRAAESSLTINSASSCCYIKLKDSSLNDVMSFFVRPNDSVTVAVPTGYYYVYFSYGKDWYGPNILFGENTVYAKDDELADYTNYTWEYTLTEVYNGNFTETPITADEFK